MRSSVLAVFLVMMLCGGVHAAQEPQPFNKLEEIIIVCKQHYDLGYTALASEVLERYRTSMMDKALMVCDETADLPVEHRFVWTLPAWPLAQMVGPEQTPERRARIVEALKEGRFVPHALPATLHTESLDLEDVVRGLEWAVNISREYGLPLPRDAKMTDVPSHVWLIPTVLAHAGIEFFHFAGNLACRPPDVPILFWWEGPDGSRVLTMHTVGYGTGIAPPSDWPFKTWVAVMHTGDNHGPPDAAEVKRMVEEAQQLKPGVKVRMGRLSDFSEAILAENPDLPVVRADFPDTWIHGIMSQPRATKLARTVRPAMGALESLDTLLDSWGVDPANRAETITKAHEQSMLYGEHTWGYDAKRFGKRLYGDEWRLARATGKYDLLEASWKEHAAYIEAAAALIEPAMEAEMEALAAAVDSSDPRVVVFNPLPWKRDAVVALPGAPAAVTDAENGAGVDADNDWDTTRFLARDVPPLGYRTYTLAPGDLASDKRDEAVDFENDYFRFTVDPARGCIASLVDKRTGKELAAPDGQYGLGQYLYERFDTNDRDAYVKSYCLFTDSWVPGDFGKPDMTPASQAAHVNASPRDFEIAARHGGVTTTVTLYAKAGNGIPHDVVMRVTFRKDAPWLDFEWEVAQKEGEPWPEAGWLCFPFAIDQPAFRVGRLGSFIDPATDIAVGANRDLLAVASAVGISGGGEHVGICPIDAPLVSLGRPGLWKYTPDYVPRESNVFVHLFNNVWSTNFAQWVEGTWSARVRIWIGDNGTNKELFTRAWEARTPCRAAAASGPAGKLPPAQAGLMLSRGGVLVTAFGNNPFGEGTLLRLWEQAGEDGPCQVTLSAGSGIKRAVPCGLRGQTAGDAIRVEEGSLEVEVNPYAPVSLTLEN